jgi:hypothetical protein
MASYRKERKGKETAKRAAMPNNSVQAAKKESYLPLGKRGYTPEPTNQGLPVPPLGGTGEIVLRHRNPAINEKQSRKSSP